MKMIFQATKLIRLWKLTSLFFVSIVMLTSCSSIKTQPADEPPEPVSIITGKSGGTKLSDIGFGSSEQSGTSLPVNAILWRAALDIASFVPLDDVDTFGGSIITEWHSQQDTPDQRLKLAIFVVGRELRSDAIRVKVYLQKHTDNLWVDAGRDTVLSRKLENLILSRARELRASMMAKTK